MLNDLSICLSNYVRDRLWALKVKLLMVGSLTIYNHKSVVIREYGNMQMKNIRGVKLKYITVKQLLTCFDNQLGLDHKSSLQVFLFPRYLRFRLSGFSTMNLACIFVIMQKKVLKLRFS